MICQHCNQPIERVPFGGWVHADTRSAFRGGHVAEPKEA